MAGWGELRKIRAWSDGGKTVPLLMPMNIAGTNGVANKRVA